MSWDDAYRGTPPWDIGRPQRAFVRLARDGAISGSVLDVGCGTGENALYLARDGHEVWGIDLSEVAIQRATIKAHARRLPVVFLVADVLDAAQVGRSFDTIIDSGCFHTLDDLDRPRYAASVHAMTAPGGQLHLMCFSEREPGDWGPRRVTRPELKGTFEAGWEVLGVRDVRFENRSGREGSHAWLATFRRRDYSTEA